MVEIAAIKLAFGGSIVSVQETQDSASVLIQLSHQNRMFQNSVLILMTFRKNGHK